MSPFLKSIEQNLVLIGHHRINLREAVQDFAMSDTINMDDMETIKDIKRDYDDARCELMDNIIRGMISEGEISPDWAAEIGLIDRPTGDRE